MAKRRRCVTCGDELSHSAYYRHLHDSNGSVCPKKKKKKMEVIPDVEVLHETSTSESEANLSLHDSTSDAYLNASDSDPDPALENPSNDTSEQRPESESSSFDFSSNSGDDLDEEELWELSASSLDEDEASGCPHIHDSQSVSRLVVAISVFVMFFHLFYNVSESAILCLLSFLKALLSHS